MRRPFLHIRLSALGQPTWFHKTKESFAFQNSSVLLVSIASIPAWGLWSRVRKRRLFIINWKLAVCQALRWLTVRLLSSFLLAALFGRSYRVSSVAKDARGSEHASGRGSFRAWAVGLRGSVSPPEHQLTRLPRSILHDALFLGDASMSYSIRNLPTMAMCGEVLSLV